MAGCSSVLEMTLPYMNLALALAREGALFAPPNPLVGAVVVKEGRVLSAGFHRRYGELHAERLCLQNDEDYSGADLYVNMEPCCHHGKTPPCTEIILQKGIRRLFISHRAPNPLVAGKGVEILRRGGVEVIEGILQEEALELNQPFLCSITRKRPYVTLKVATSLDGRLAAHTGESERLSSPLSHEIVHLIRRESDAIMVGKGTLLKDNPLLTVRGEGEGKPLLRAVLSSHLDLEERANLFHTPQGGDVHLFASRECDPHRVRLWGERGVKVHQVGSGDGGLNLEEVLAVLQELRTGRLLVEGGGALASSFLKADLVDRLVLFMDPSTLLGDGIPFSGSLRPLSPAQGRRLKKVRFFDLDTNILLEGFFHVYGDR